MRETKPNGMAMHRCSGLQSSTSLSFTHSSPVVTYMVKKEGILEVNPLAPASAVIEINTCHLSLPYWDEASDTVKQRRVYSALPFWIPDLLDHCALHHWVPFVACHPAVGIHSFLVEFEGSKLETTYLKISLTSLLIGSTILGCRVIS